MPSNLKNTTSKTIPSHHSVPRAWGHPPGNRVRTANFTAVTHTSHCTWRPDPMPKVNRLLAFGRGGLCLLDIKWKGELFAVVNTFNLAVITPQRAPFHNLLLVICGCINGAPVSYDLRRKFVVNVSQSLFWLLTNTQHCLCFGTGHRGEATWILLKQRGVPPPTLVNNTTWNHLSYWSTKHRIQKFLQTIQSFFEIAKTIPVKTVTVHIFLKVSLLGFLFVLPTNE